ncbi:cob(I)yrinic acid a,c-diamide adenosyltransferase [Effusibacillus lacus]|uniref:Corrinoid adenosyltransferase n=1 Tax=Effusibacillus lacus TaxID=1348429 RepID=A0A292YJY5_9BACL|nr:cob(I)yrinic acid a,c-diamide adenosyltransferase [Effusibacillus lacus]TCS72854.1 cob(I)alamin adenosyltransferase [Effusibacillus lacus]GAX89221.1 ATP--cob(I)alamin adenosyltransferase [Effusibacillus lacus]
MKIYTRTGDKGMTSLIGGRVRKDAVRVEAYGTLDELNSFVGQAKVLMDPERHKDMLEDLTEIQHELFDAGGDLAYVQAPKGQEITYKVNKDMVSRLEQWIDRYDAECPPIKRFVLPGGSPVSAALHVCRTVSRRAERRVVKLSEQEAINEDVQKYLNRLSDFFFAIARAANVRDGVGDVEYKRGGEVFR